MSPEVALAPPVACAGHVKVGLVPLVLKLDTAGRVGTAGLEVAALGASPSIVSRCEVEEGGRTDMETAGCCDTISGGETEAGDAEEAGDTEETGGGL